MRNALREPCRQSRPFLHGNALADTGGESSESGAQVVALGLHRSELVGAELRLPLWVDPLATHRGRAWRWPQQDESFPSFRSPTPVRRIKADSSVALTHSSGACRAMFGGKLSPRGHVRTTEQRPPFRVASVTGASLLSTVRDS